MVLWKPQDKARGRFQGIPCSFRFKDEFNAVYNSHHRPSCCYCLTLGLVSVPSPSSPALHPSCPEQEDYGRRAKTNIGRCRKYVFVNKNSPTLCNFWGQNPLEGSVVWERTADKGAASQVAEIMMLFSWTEGFKLNIASSGPADDLAR